MTPHPATLDFLLATLADPLPVERLRALARQGVDWDGLFIACRRHGLFPLVNRSLLQLSPANFPEPHRQRFRDASAACVLHSLQMQQEMRRLLALLAGAGIPVIPFKGPLLAEQAYGDVGMRDFVDLDFLVPKGQVAAAVSLLAEHGYRQPSATDCRDWKKLFSTTNEVNLQHDSQPWVVEVQWDFAKPWQALNFSLESLWHGIDSCSTDNRLDDATTLLHLCVHGTNHYWDKLKWVVDVDRFVRRYPPSDWAELFSLAGKIGCSRSLLLGLALANSCLGLPLPPPVMHKMNNCNGLWWLKKYAMDGWLQSAERKRLFAGRIFFILLGRDTNRARLKSIRRGMTGSYS